MYIYSKMANGITFVEYEKSRKERTVNMPRRIVAIDGGAGVTNKVTLQVPDYIETEISKEDYEFLKDNETFRGFEIQGLMYASKKQLKPFDVMAVLFDGDGCAPLDEDTVKQKAKANGIKSEFDIVVNGR